MAEELLAVEIIEASRGPVVQSLRSACLEAVAQGMRDGFVGNTGAVRAGIFVGSTREVMVAIDVGGRIPRHRIGLSVTSLRVLESVNVEVRSLKDDPGGYSNYKFSIEPYDEQHLIDTLYEALDNIHSEEFGPSTTARSGAAWSISTELLLTHLSRLLEDRSLLEDVFRIVYDDLQVAKARIRELESLNEALRIERYELKDHTDLIMIAQYALVVATAFGPVLGNLAADQEGKESIEQVVKAAQQVQVDCGDFIINMPPVEAEQTGTDEMIERSHPKAMDKDFLKDGLAG